MIYSYQLFSNTHQSTTIHRENDFRLFTAGYSTFDYFFSPLFILHNNDNKNKIHIKTFWELHSTALDWTHFLFLIIINYNKWSCTS